jgi:hypothetical protein
LSAEFLRRCMPRKSGSVALFGLCLAATGCIPERLAYLEPSAAVGRVEPDKPRCGGPSDTITFSPANLVTPDLIEVRLGTLPPSRTTSRQLFVLLWIRKNVHTEFSLLPSSVETQKQRAARYMALKTLPVEIEFADDTVPLAWADGGRTVWHLSLPDRARRWTMTDAPLFQKLPVPGFSGDWLDVQLPTISFDGKPLAFPPVRFEAGSALFFMPINC